MSTSKTPVRPATMRRSRRAAHTSPIRKSEEATSAEIQQLRAQVMHLRAAAAEQEETIAFLRDLLSQRWFETTPG